MCLLGDVPLASVDLLVGVKTADSAHPRAGDRLAVNNQCAGLAVAPFPAPGRPTRNAQNTPDTSFLSPSSEVVVNGLPRGKSTGQHAPLSARFDNIQDCVQDVVSEVVLPAASGRKIAADFFPLGVRHVGVVALLAHGSGKSFSEEIVHSSRKRGGLPSVFENGC